VSNFRAVAAVTQTLRTILDVLAGNAVAGAHATTLRPDEASATNKAGVNIFLYQIAPNPSWRNEDLPTRPEDGKGILRRPRAAIDLHYLFTFHGIDSDFEPQRILGTVVQILHANPILDRTLVRSAIGATGVPPDLAFSDLADDIEVVRMTPLPLSIEELSKLWSIFQAKYALSAAYQASVVLLEGEETPRPPIPVASHRVVVVPSTGPVLERLLSQGAGAGAAEVSGVPAVITDKLIIEGRGLRGPSTTKVRIGQSVFTPPAADVDRNRIVIDTLGTQLPAAEQRAGVKLVQVIHDIDFGTPADPHHGFESNALPFMLSPTVGVTSATHAQVVLSVDPPLTVGQRAVLLLSQTPVPAVPPTRAYSFPKIVDVAGPSITVPISGVIAGDYVVRLQVDGAESPIDVDSATGLYKDTPKASIP
jgi:hypothetical protein